MFSKSVIQKVITAANKINVEPSAILAVGEVEAAGVTSWNVKGESKPPIRFEGHYFYRLLKGNKAKVKAAIRAGLASPKAGAVKNPASYEARYALLERAKKIDPAAALASTSWGLGQVMGDHWKKLGYSSVQALVAEASRGVDGQIDLMVRYIIKFGLVDELQTYSFQSFADQYNGPASRKNRYGEKITAAYKRYKVMLAKGVTDNAALVEAAYDATQIQKDLAKLGFYKGPINGKYGPMTRAAVRSFQKKNGLNPDGKYGKMTDELVDEQIMKHRLGNDDKLIAGGSGTTTLAPVTDMVRDTTDQFTGLSYYTQSDFVTYFIIGLTLLGVGLAAFGLYRKFRRNSEG